MDDYDEQVDELDDEVFARCAREIGDALHVGMAAIVAFQPGDGTKYDIEVGNTYVTIISDGEESRGFRRDIGSTRFVFGTTSCMQAGPWGHVSWCIKPDHPWTAAVWRRLYALIQQHLDQQYLEEQR